MLEWSHLLQVCSMCGSRLLSHSAVPVDIFDQCHALCVCLCVPLCASHDTISIPQRSDTNHFAGWEQQKHQAFVTRLKCRPNHGSVSPFVDRSDVMVTGRYKNKILIMS